jgi:hypothetical protein
LGELRFSQESAAKKATKELKFRVTPSNIVGAFKTAQSPLVKDDWGYKEEHKWWNIIKECSSSSVCYPEGMEILVNELMGLCEEFGTEPSPRLLELKNKLISNRG